MWEGYKTFSLKSVFVPIHHKGRIIHLIQFNYRACVVFASLQSLFTTGR